MAGPNSTNPGEAVADRANDMYWNSERTVDEVVADLGISRGALYSAIRPVPTGTSCSICGGRLMYTNRTSRASGVATCSSCEAEVDLTAEPVGVAGRADQFTSFGERYDEVDGGALSRWRHDLAAVPRERAALIGGAAALGMVVGAVAARAVRG